mmetsp:Transcript_45065/g.145004  ORF Transcript_45065/g.145004 Transcript_45065/m.145004 type:complete len:279 (-) Transcript_45065:350-1186(-)
MHVPCARTKERVRSRTRRRGPQTCTEQRLRFTRRSSPRRTARTRPKRQTTSSCPSTSAASSQSSTGPTRLIGCATAATARGARPTSPRCAPWRGSATCCSGCGERCRTGTGAAARTTCGLRCTTRARATRLRSCGTPRCSPTGGGRTRARTARASTTSGASTRTREACTAGAAATTRARTSCFRRGEGPRRWVRRPICAAAAAAAAATAAAATAEGRDAICSSTSTATWAALRSLKTTRLECGNSCGGSTATWQLARRGLPTAARAAAAACRMASGSS